MKPNAKCKALIRSLLGVVLTCIVIIFLFRDATIQLRENKEDTITSFKQEQFDMIWNSLNNLQAQANKEVTKISKNIEKDILSLSEDELNKIQTDMTENMYNEILHGLIMKNIEDENLNNINNHRNGIVVMCNDGYLEDFNYRRAKNSDNSSFRSWEDSIEMSYNKELEKNAIDKLLNRSSGIIATEFYDLTNDVNHAKIKELTYSSLYDIFLQEGINGLRNYQIFVPYYITDLGDIFGVPDIIQGNKVDNNKIIVVQEFNLYDQIMNAGDTFDNDEIKNISHRYDSIIRRIQLIAIILILLLIILIFCICPVYNAVIDQDDTDYKDTHHIEENASNGSDLTDE